MPNLTHNDHYRGQVYTQVSIYDSEKPCCSVISKAGQTLISIAAIILSVVSIMASFDAEGSEFRVLPSITLKEEYNDNILLTTENRYIDYITTTSPAFSLVYLAPKWDWKMDYTFNYQYYARGTINNELFQTLNLTSTNRIVTDVLFLVVNDQYSRVSLDIVRDFTQESSFVHLTDRNFLTVNPYLHLTPLSHMTVTTGYIYQNTWYKDPNAIARTNHIGYADVRQEISPRSALLAGIRHTLDITTVTTHENYTEDNLYLGLYHEFSGNSSVTFKAGNIWTNYESGGRTTQAFWDATITQRYPSVTITGETGLRYITDPFGARRREDRYFATVRKDVERSSVVVSGGLTEYREATHNNLQNTDYRLTGTISHNMTIKSRLALDLTADRYDYNQTGDSTHRYITGARFEYLAQEQLTLTLDYRYTNLYSPNILTDNYDNNRFYVELRKVF